jgi:hypothetical protein
MAPEEAAHHQNDPFGVPISLGEVEWLPLPIRKGGDRAPTAKDAEQEGYDAFR